MTGVNFSKERAEYYLRCLDRGEPLEAPAPGWTADEMLQLAGACSCVIASQGPRWLQAQGVDVSQLQEEQREATDASVVPELSSAIEWIAQRCFEVVDGNYDQEYEAEHKLLLTYDDGEVTVRPVQGFKVLPGTDADADD